jgi:hypothetical protein
VLACDGETMGKILFETNSATYEIEKSDQEVLERFGEITGIKVKVKSIIQLGLVESCVAGTTPVSQKERKPFNSDTIPPNEDIINYIKNHLDGYNTSIVLEHFFGYVPKYGESPEQDRLIGMLNARINRARQAVSKELHGDFQKVNKGGTKVYVFKRLTETEVLSDPSTDDNDPDSGDEDSLSPSSSDAFTMME